MLLVEGRDFTSPTDVVPGQVLVDDAPSNQGLFINVADYITDSGAGSILLVTFAVPVPEQYRDAVDPDERFAEPMMLHSYVLDMECAQQVVKSMQYAIETVLGGKPRPDDFRVDL